MKTWEEYKEQALKTEEILPQDTPVDIITLRCAIKQSTLALKVLDFLKKRIFYNKPIPEQEFLITQTEIGYSNGRLMRVAMQPETMETERTCKIGTCQVGIGDVSLSFRLLHAILGIATEAGELLTLLYGILTTSDAVEKGTLYSKFIDELGDVFWYLAEALDVLGLNIEDVLNLNIAKLRVRFGEKFSQEACNNRDLESEEAVFDQISASS